LGVELKDIKNKGEFILMDGMPTKHLIYKRNGKLARIITKDSISIKKGKELNKWAKNIVKFFYKELELKRCDNK
jgi:hypothetical protein